MQLRNHLKLEIKWVEIKMIHMELTTQIIKSNSKMQR